MNKSLHTSALLIAITLAACDAPVDQQTPNATPTETAPVAAALQTPAASNPVVDASFGSGGGTWDRFGSILFRYTGIERDGEIYLCGAFTAQGGTKIRDLSREVMRQGFATANGETVLRNIQFFKEASNAAFGSGLMGVETNCRTTGRPVGSFAPETLRVGTRSGRY